METDRTEFISSSKPQGGVLAMYIAAMVTILSVGILHLIGHANPKFKAFLKFHDGIGPLLGKVVLAYFFGAVVFAVLYFVLRKKQEVNHTMWLIMLFATLVIGTLLVFTPFVEIVA